MKIHVSADKIRLEYDSIITSSAKLFYALQIIKTLLYLTCNSSCRQVCVCFKIRYALFRTHTANTKLIFFFRFPKNEKQRFEASFVED